MYIQALCWLILWKEISIRIEYNLWVVDQSSRCANTRERRARFSCKWTTRATATNTQRFIKQVPSQGKLKLTSLCLQIGFCDRPINVGKLANTNSFPSEATLGDLYFVSWDKKFVHVLVHPGFPNSLMTISSILTFVTCKWQVGFLINDFWVSYS